MGSAIAFTRICFQGPYIDPSCYQGGWGGGGCSVGTAFLWGHVGSAVQHKLDMLSVTSVSAGCSTIFRHHAFGVSVLLWCHLG